MKASRSVRVFRDGPIAAGSIATIAPLGFKSWVSADELADMALFLASPAAAKVSGQIMAVDGHTESIN